MPSQSTRFRISLASDHFTHPAATREIKLAPRASALLIFLTMNTSARNSSMQSLDIQQNLRPAKCYEITLMTKDAPGLFDSVTGFVQYKVSNNQCVPQTPISGATLTPEHRVPLELQRVSDYIYKGQLYADLLRDEDYFGMGVCHWGVLAATVNLNIHGADLNASLFDDEIFSEASATNYFLDSDYFGKSSNPLVLGDRDTQRQLRNFRSDIFSVTLDAKREHP